MGNFHKLIFIECLVVLLGLIIIFILKHKRKDIPVKKEEWVQRHRNMAKKYSETHKAGTRVVAESKNGTWKKGEIIGNHDWELFTFFFTIEFDDGEIIKQEETKVTKI